jgi:dihydrofolate reductase
MAGKVFFSVSMSLDGFIAPESLEDLMGQQWMELQQWVFPQRFFRENLKLGKGGEEGRDNDILRETFERTGASVMGKRMFDAGEQAWPEEAPFHTPVFVVTHQKRDPWERPGGTTFHFVNDIETALDQAREAAGERDVRIAGGGATILEYVNAGLIDEFSIALSPVLFGSGIRCSMAWTRAAWPWSRSARSPPQGDAPGLRSPGAVTGAWTSYGKEVHPASWASFTSTRRRTRSSGSGSSIAKCSDPEVHSYPASSSVSSARTLPLCGR